MSMSSSIVKCPHCNGGKYDLSNECKVCGGTGGATPEAADQYIRGWSEFHLKHIHEYAERNKNNVDDDQGPTGE